MTALGTRIKELRTKAGMSVEAAVAKASGITVSMWYKIESGDRNPSVENLERVAKALGCSVADLFLPLDSTQSGIGALSAVSA